MKTGNVCRATRWTDTVARENRTAQKKDGAPVEEKVDLSTKKAPVIPSAATSYDDVLELLYGIDFSQFKNVEWMSREGSSKMMELLST